LTVPLITVIIGLPTLNSPEVVPSYWRKGGPINVAGDMVASLAFALCLAATAGAPNVVLACVALIVTGAAAFSFVTLASTTLQLHSSSAYRGRIMALWVFVYIGTTPIGSILTGWIIAASGPRIALLVGAGACLVAALFAERVRTPPDPDASLTDLAN
jgi:MFS family permease